MLADLKGYDDSPVVYSRCLDSERSKADLDSQ